MENPWAERIYTFTDKGSGERSRIFVLLGRPYTEVGKAWHVNVEIREGGQEPLTLRAAGDDSLQALQTALASLPELLKPWTERGELRWQDSVDLGLS